MYGKFLYGFPFLRTQRVKHCTLIFKLSYTAFRSGVFFATSCEGFDLGFQLSTEARGGDEKGGYYLLDVEKLAMRNHHSAGDSIWMFKKSKKLERISGRWSSSHVCTDAKNRLYLNVDASASKNLKKFS